MESLVSGEKKWESDLNTFVLDKVLLYALNIITALPNAADSVVCTVARQHNMFAFFRGCCIDFDDCC